MLVPSGLAAWIRSGGNKKLIIIVAVAVLVSIGAAVGVTLVLTGGKHHEKEVAAKHEKGDDEEAADAEDGDEEAAPEEEDEAAKEGEGEGAKEGAEGKGGAGPEYVALDPPFVVNFQDAQKRTKFLKAEISVVAPSHKAQEAITRHMPAVRNSLVLLLSKQVFEELSTNDGKEKLRVDALGAVQEVIKKQTNKKTSKGVKDLFFSSLVMQ